MRGFAICGERRSGGNYLCDLLRSTGVLGQPREWFVPQVVRAGGIADYPDEPQAQVSLIPTLAATPNGVYGVLLHAVEFDRVLTTRWAERLPALRFVFLERRDLLGQAISYVRAGQTNQWVAHMTATAPPSYDPQAICDAMVSLLSGQSRWRFWLARNNLPYLHLVYEDLVAAPQAAVAAVARLVGVSEPAVIDATRLRLRIQRDDLSEEWRTRFLAEMRDLGRFD